MTQNSNVVTLPNIRVTRRLTKLRQVQEATIKALGQENAPADIQSFIRFACFIRLDTEQIRLRLPGALEAYGPEGMPAELRRLHIERMNRPNEADRQQIITFRSPPSLTVTFDKAARRICNCSEALA